MKIAIAQINPIMGDLNFNLEKILQFSHDAFQKGAELIVTPELSLTGYSPEDLLLRPSFYTAGEKALLTLARRLADEVSPQCCVVVGYPRAGQDGEYYNAAAVLQFGKIVTYYDKQSLPNYMVFDEERYFTAGDRPCVFDLNGIRFGINICADIWNEEAPTRAKEAGAEILLVLNASPYHMGKQQARHQLLTEQAMTHHFAIVYANLVGGQDELVFDGASCVFDATGKLTHQFSAFREELGLIEFDTIKREIIVGKRSIPAPLEANIYECLCLGVKDYVEKNGFRGVLLGLSGGIDSALTLAIAVDALGPERVSAIMMPSPYTAQISLDDSRQMIENLRVFYKEIPIDGLFTAYLDALSPQFEALGYQQKDTTEENLQARIRGNILMAFSNKTGALVLTTGNKSEMAVGYATLYGDMAGGFGVLKDITKTMVYRLARYRNSINADIPERIITRAPSAELKPDQKDQDTLPPYDILDQILEYYVEQDYSIQEMITAGLSEKDVRQVVRMIDLSEYKRRQAPIGIRVTYRGFGKDRRYPITNHFQPI